jgi:hypothetical protein
LNYGQYFKAISDVISRETYRSLVDATSKKLRQDISLSHVDDVVIYAEKHGSDYHPARIEVLCGGKCAAFVMNVAVTARGKSRLDHECDVLQTLNQKHGYPFLPHVYDRGSVSVPIPSDKGSEVSTLMFLADWFEGYHEFHLSSVENDDTQRLLLWDTKKGPWQLSREQATEVYRKAATILTLYYDVETFEQIFPWHHAAGDFIVQAEEGVINVRLVTARQYAPMIEPNEDMPPWEALLFFLLNLSVRMRLDRLDGTGSLAWADSSCVPAVLGGFMEALQEKVREGRVSEDVVNVFLRFCGSMEEEDLSERFQALVDAYDPSAPDVPVIRPHLSEHISNFWSVLQRAVSKDFL